MSALQDWLGREETRHDVVSAGLLARFIATIESRARCMPGATPPGLHWCLCPPNAPLSDLGEDGHPRKGGFLPPVPLPRRMWAAGSLEFLAPIPVGAQLQRHSRIVAISEKTGKSGAMVFVELLHSNRVDGVEAVRECQTIVYREPAMQALPLHQPQPHEPGQWSLQRSLVPSETLLFRFSALTFNSHRIHYDLPYAQQREGYPALVVQAPLTAALLLDLAASDAGCEAITGFSFRAVAPAFAGQALQLSGRDNGTQLELAAFDADGRTVMEAQATLRG
jgi:3-methylfumaryl-CoA hydratase